MEVDIQGAVLVGLQIQSNAEKSRTPRELKVGSVGSWLDVGAEYGMETYIIHMPHKALL